jgi:inward rectifier potassium channel
MMHFRRPRRDVQDDDPGLGSKAFASGRLVLPDGTFNVRRLGLDWFERFHLYHWLVELSWSRFLGLTLAGYAVANTLFAAVYYLLGNGDFAGLSGIGGIHLFRELWFFSAQTMTTVGYGHVSPVSILAGAVSSLEALSGLMGIAVGTGLLYGRFSRPRSRVIFSKVSVVLPYRDGFAWMFRLVAPHRHALLEAKVQVLCSWVEEDEAGNRMRRYRDLRLERDEVHFLPMNWTLVHAIEDDSPLVGLTAADLLRQRVEVMVLFRAFDESYGQQVFARRSWTAEEILFGRKFVPMLFPDPSGAMDVDVAKLHETETVAMEREF